MRIDKKYANKFIQSCGLNMLKNKINIKNLETLNGVFDNSQDAVILDCVLNRVYDYEALIVQSKKVLKKNGILVCVLSSIAPSLDKDISYWGFTEASARYIFSKFFQADEFAIQVFGNVLSGKMLLSNCDVDKLTHTELDYSDPYFPIVIGVKALKKYVK